MKFCSKCGKKLNGDTKFCVYCGNLLKVTADPVKSTNKKQESEACVSNITPMGKKTKIKATLKKIVFCFAWAVIWLFIGMGFTWFSMTVAEHNKQWEESQKEKIIWKKWKFPRWMNGIILFPEQQNHLPLIRSCSP